MQAVRKQIKAGAVPTAPDLVQELLCLKIAPIGALGHQASNTVTRRATTSTVSPPPQLVSWPEFIAGVMTYNVPGRVEEWVVLRLV